MSPVSKLDIWRARQLIQRAARGREGVEMVKAAFHSLDPEIAVTALQGAHKKNQKLLEEAMDQPFWSLQNEMLSGSIEMIEAAAEELGVSLE